MAHHDSTPASVLDAPSRTTTSTPPEGATRLERRKGIVPPAGLDAKNLARYKLHLMLNRNVPAGRVEPRRGKKVKRNRIGGAK